MCDYPFFIPQVVLFANSSLFWFKVTNEHREFRNYLFAKIKYRKCPQVKQRMGEPEDISIKIVYDEVVMKLG